MKKCKVCGKDLAHDKLVGCAMEIIEQIIEPLHYPQRGVNGSKYYELEDSIIEIIKANKLK